MSGGGRHYYFGSGDHVTLHGGSGNVGIDKRVTPAPEPAPAVQEALRELLALVQELRGQVPQAGAEALDDSLPALRAEANVPQQERHRALYAVAGIAGTLGALGVPIVEAVNKVLGLLGAQ
ncbi:hypothetical protein Sgleb_51150 [Streptomyces glebosus]|uniref:Uncharacterized protein n=1 Tax=Streptomyces glebosus TaxID=249580 RepID=A0A640T195_9ACTN|nr:hypothetical protein [Streptomyces glebosus]GFE17068.1 hypothetical protein Sgleb_51150 [Streptomyces glebosus]GHG53358.1 hypothetical protein GCM10010513_14090 [Streptomyces glebosus]